MQKEPLFGKTLDELKQIAAELELPAYTSGQIAYWLYKTDVDSFDGMTNVSKKVRSLLAENYSFGVKAPAKVNESADGTKKYLFTTGAGKFVEAAYIPDGKRHTLCVSSQVGCKMGCLFCMTGKQGFQGHLTAGEILNQLRSIPESKTITNIVYMGMGEPFDNLEQVMKSLEIVTAEYGFAISVRKVTVSTIGIVPAMRVFLEQSKCNLAVSLHTPFEDERKRLMPIQTVYPLKEVVATIQAYDLGKYRRVSFEYIMFKGVNDTRRHVNELARILNKVRSRINLIRFHPIPGTPLECSDEATIIDFQQALNDKGIVTTLRASRGQDIEAACGLLSTKELVKMQQTDE
ncbi:MAG: 23S rRNA (adenine(2503)-C(2))-methyltransferase RlmN [Lentimicrobium sp.]|nr:23S rRNA (adenine(2503)-C(2))-methyltransferase RlmN [Lentimicrobium sp.]